MPTEIPCEYILHQQHSTSVIKYLEEDLKRHPRSWSFEMVWPHKFLLSCSRQVQTDARFAGAERHITRRASSRDWMNLQWFNCPQKDRPYFIAVHQSDRVGECLSYIIRQVQQHEFNAISN